MLYKTRINIMSDLRNVYWKFITRVPSRLVNRKTKFTNVLSRLQIPEHFFKYILNFKFWKIIETDDIGSILFLLRDICIFYIY